MKIELNTTNKTPKGMVHEYIIITKRKNVFYLIEKANGTAELIQKDIKKIK